MTNADPKLYVLDKALNYGNSGGPIIAQDTGMCHAICTRFQPVFIPQQHLADKDGNFPSVMIPSLYGVVSRFDNQAVIQQFQALGIEYSED